MRLKRCTCSSQSKQRRRETKQRQTASAKFVTTKPDIAMFSRLPLGISSRTSLVGSRCRGFSLGKEVHHVALDKTSRLRRRYPFGCNPDISSCPIESTG